MQKQRRGITLVALVITIIILLILAGITISLTIGQQGILRRAEEAGKNYITAAEYENQQLTNFLKEADEIIDGIEDKKELPENALAKKVDIGDYVAYDPTAGVMDTSILEYKSPVGTGMQHGNGHNEQKFTATNSTKWRVLSKDETTGEVALISETPLLTDEGIVFNIYSAIGYLYVEQELNEICKIYGYGKGANVSKTFIYKTGNGAEEEDIGTITGSGARSINTEDINRIAKYDPTTFMIESEGIIYKYGDPWTHNIFYPTKTTPTGRSETIKERTEKFTMHFYTGSKYITNTNIYKMLFGNGDIYYWLASRCAYPNATTTDYSVQYVGEGSVYCAFILRGDVGGFREYAVGSAIRPIVYLKPDILTNKQDENGAWVISE